MKMLLPCVVLSCCSLTAAIAQTPPPRMTDPSSIQGVMNQPLLVLPPTPKPAPVGNFIGLSSANGRIAWDFIDLWFNQKQPGAAFDRYVAPTGYVNHAMGKPGEVQTFEAQKAAESRIVPPGSKFIFKQVISQGDLVVLHINAFPGGDTPGDELVEILRIRSGRVVDHWDLHVPAPAGSTVFDRMER